MTETTGTEIRLAELIGALALATDLAFGQPLEHEFRTCLLSMRLGEHLGLRGDELRDLYDVSLLRYLGCTGHAAETAATFGDEISARSRAAMVDYGKPSEMVFDLLRHGGEGRPLPERARAVGSALAGGRSKAAEGFRGGCEVARALAGRLELSDGVTAALWHAFERWDGKGFPDGVRADAVALPMRIVHVAQDAEVLHRLGGMDAAVRTVRERSTRAYDPALAEAFVAHAPALFEGLGERSAWEAVMDAEPAPHRVLRGDGLDRALTVAADFADLKSPYTPGHSRGVADLAARAAGAAGLGEGEAHDLRRAGLVHDLGRTAVPNSIWDKPGPLTDAERERVRLHAYFTGRMLARGPELARLGDVASMHHERQDGSGYHRNLRGQMLPMPARILAAADAYQAMTEPRAYRPAFTPLRAAEELRAAGADGLLDPEAVRAVLGAAGHRVGRRGEHPAGLSDREVEVLRLLARGMTSRAVAGELFISEKTASHHVQHIYSKIGVSTRGAAALFAVQNGLLPSEA